MDKATLEKKRLMDLRVYGRAVGVKSPSSLRKEDLIDKIIAIESGKLQPTKITRGRKLGEKLDLGDINIALSSPEEKYEINSQELYKLFSPLEKIKLYKINLIKLNQILESAADFLKKVTDSLKDC
jgi:hypothetical protein